MRCHSFRFMSVLMLLCALTAQDGPAADWYSRYQHSENGLVALFPFNGTGEEMLRDTVSRKTAAAHDVTAVPGHMPAASLVFDGKGRMNVPDAPEASSRKDFTISVYAKITGGGDYLVLKKGSFGLRFNDGRIGAYLRTADKKDAAFPAGTYDGAWHHYVLTVAGKTATTYVDGVRTGGRTLTAPPAVSGEDICLGHSANWGKKQIVGEVRLFRVTDKALTPAEVAAESAALHKGEIPAPDPAQSLQVPMDARNAFVGDDISYEKKEQAFYFDGKKGSLTLPDYPALRDAKALTVGAWIKPEHTMPRSMAEQGCIVSAHAGAHAGWSIGTYYNNGLSVNLITDQGKFGASAAQVLTPNVWQHVAFVWNGEIIQLFVNGRKVGQSAKAPGKLKAFRGRPTVGRAADRNGIYFKGTIDEVRIFDTALLDATDPDTGKPVVTAATNTDVDPLKEPLEPFRGTAGYAPPVTPLFDFEDLSGWTVKCYRNVSEATLSRSQDDRLWGDYVGKLVCRAGTHFDPGLKKIMIGPAKPLAVTGEFDCVGLWISAQNWTKPSGCKASLQFKDAHGKLHNVELQTAEWPFIFWSGWSLAMCKIPEPIPVPAQFLGMTFYNFGGRTPEVYYLDNLFVFKRKEVLPEGAEIPTWREIGAPNVPTAAMPTLLTPEKPVAFARSGNTFTFTAASGDDRIVYTYTPKTGTLSDIRASFNGGAAFQPLRDGGFRFADDHTGAEIPAAELRPELLKTEVRGNVVTTRWQWSRGNRPLARTQIALSAQRKTLSVALSGGDGKVAQVRTGAVAGVADPILTNIPFWVIRSKGVNDPAVLYSNKMLLSAFCDIYRSQASRLVGGSKILADGSCQVNGGSAYDVKTDGKRNEVGEVIHLTLSSRLAEVLPHIANPVNPANELTRNGIWVTRMWYDAMPMADYFPRAYGMWELFHRYGMRNLMIRDHQSLYRQYSPKRRGGFDGLNDSILPDIGGDRMAAEYFERATEKLGYRMGIYENDTLNSLVQMEMFDLDKITLDGQGNPRYGSDGAKMYKYAYMVSARRKLNAVLKSKFKLLCAYPDQYTCRAPWSFTDLDARAPEAGRFAPVLRVLAKCLILEREAFEIPLSEGIMQWPLAGFCDSYAQSGSPDDPIFPEFQLRKIHPLCNDTGSHLQISFANKPELVDRALAMQFANGTIGHLYGTVGGKPHTKAKAETLKSYYIPKQTQKYYAGVAIDTIRYHHQGKMLTAEEAIAARCVGGNQVYLKYVNGFEVWVNLNAKEPWQITAGGVGYTLPPCGYAAKLDGKVLTYSVLRDGHRADFSQGDEYVYANGNGVKTDFGAVECAHAYALLHENDAVEIIPAPFVKPETVLVRLDKLPWKTGRKLLALDKEGKTIREEPLAVSGGKVLLDIKDEVFSYKIVQ